MPALVVFLTSSTLYFVLSPKLQRSIRTFIDMSTQPVLIAGAWRPANSSGTFRAENPATREPLDEFPVSTWDDCDEALTAAAQAAEQMRGLTAEQIAAF